MRSWRDLMIEAMISTGILYIINNFYILQIQTTRAMAFHKAKSQKILIYIIGYLAYLIAIIKGLNIRVKLFCQIAYKVMAMKNSEWENQAGITQRLSTLKRNTKSTYTTPTQEEYINQVAKNRLLEDELLAEKIKCQTLQRKGYEYIDTIAQLEYTIGNMKLMLQKADREIERHMMADRQIEAYSSNLRQVGQQLSSLNQIVEKKNKQCQKLLQNNIKLKQQNSQLDSKMRVLQNRKEIEKSKLRDILECLGTDSEPSFGDELIREIELIEEGVNEMRQTLSRTKAALEKQRKQSSQSLIKQKERIISLEYSLKLAEKRNEDLEKKKNLQSTFTLDKKVEDMIEQMLKKQQELSTRISQLESENEVLKEQLEIEKQSNSHFMQLKEKDYNKQIKEAKQTIKQLIHEKNQISEKFEGLCHTQEIESSRLANEEIEMGKKYREYCQENKRLKLKIGELESDKKMLEKELSFRNAN